MLLPVALWQIVTKLIQIFCTSATFRVRNDRIISLLGEQLPLLNIDFNRDVCVPNSSYTKDVTLKHLPKFASLPRITKEGCLLLYRELCQWGFIEVLQKDSAPQLPIPSSAATVVSVIGEATENIKYIWSWILCPKILLMITFCVEQ